MASSEQPLKKRKLYELPPEPPAPEIQPQSTVVQPQTPPPLSQDEILARRRNKDEIRSVYDCYKKLKACIATKDVRHLPEIEQAYLSLISASRGCLSVQRIVADLIPRYASYCPTALEAAIKVVINMHNWCLAVINRGEDADGVAFETAKACIFGLADICHIASSEAPASSVIRGICSAVFHNVLEFFISSSDGENLIHTVDERILKIIVSDEILPRLKQKISDEDEASLIKLAKFRGLSLLQTFILCPKNLLAACLELFNPAAQEGVHKGLYLLTQFVRRLDDNGAAHPSVKKGTEAISVDTNTNAGGAATSEEIVSGDKYAVVDASKESKSCILGLVLSQNPSLRRWFSLRYERLCKLSSSTVVSEIRSILEGLLGSFPELSKVEEREVESDEDGSYPSNYVKQQYLPPRFSNEHEISREQYQKDSSRIHTGSYGSSNDSGGTRSVDFEASDHVNLSCGRSSMPRELSNPQMLSPAARRPLYNRNNSFDGRNHGSSGRSVGGCSSNTLVSPNHHLSVPYASTPTPIHWYFDGDPAAMDIVSASRHLWLGLFGPDASEAHIRFHLERFGPLDQFLFFPIKGFALAEYRNIIDAIRTREYIRGHFPWCIKFMDRGLGTRGAINGLAVGSSSYVYVGNVPNQWARDEILHESSKVVCKGRFMVTDLSCEGALLIEFETPEEATSAMAHLRQHRQSKSSYLPTANAGPLNATMSHIDCPRPLHPAPIHVDFRSNHPSNMPASVYGSPHGSSFHSASQPRMMHHGGPFSMRPEGSSMQLVSPRPRSENQGTAIQCGHPLQSNWTAPGYTDMHEVGVRNIESHDNNIMISSSQGGNLPCPPIATQGHIPPPQQIQPSPFMRPAYLPPNSPWDATSSNHQMPLNPAPSSAMPNTFHGNPVSAPFIPPSVTPLAQIQGASLQNFDPVFSHPMVPPPLLSQPPPQPEEPPPLPPSPPPLPESQPPLAPPPPSSPPPPPVVESMAVESCGQLMQYQWQGALCKSGVHYSTIFAQRENSDLCKYSQAIVEPHEWPAKLDMTKRTDYQHVKSTFANTPTHKREVCRLIPSSVSDLKGFQDFVSYLKQRECAGVIKIPAVKPIWARLLFILPYSQDMCSMLGITPNPSDCLIALVLPKETHSEYA